MLWAGEWIAHTRVLTSLQHVCVFDVARSLRSGAPEQNSVYEARVTSA